MANLTNPANPVAPQEMTRVVQELCHLLEHAVETIAQGHRDANRHAPPPRLTR